MKKENNAGITIGGIALVIGVAVATVFSSVLVVNKMNNNANDAYLSTLQTIQMGKASVQEDSSSDTKTDIVVDDKVTVDAEDSKKHIVIIDGESYISSEYVDEVNASDVDSDNTNTLALDSSKVVTVDGVDYIHIDTDNSIVGDDITTENGYIGLNYVDIDVDGSVVYHINKGDTLSEISGKLGYSVDSIADENEIRNPNLIYEGSSLRVPMNDTIKHSVKDSKTSDSDTNKTSKENTTEETTEE